MKRQGGFSFPLVIAAIAVVGIGLAVAGQAYTETQRRVREQDLVRTGGAYIRALQAYYESSPGAQKTLPTRLDELVEDLRFAGVRRHLRKIYVDPVTGGDWGLVRTPAGTIAGVYSLSEAPPLAAGTIMVAGQRVRFGERYRDTQFVFVPPEASGAPRR